MAIRQKYQWWGQDDDYHEAVRIAMENVRELSMPHLLAIESYCSSCGQPISPARLKAMREKSMRDIPVSSDHLPSYERGRARIERGEYLFNREHPEFEG